MCSVMAGLTALGGYAQYRGQQQAANAQAAAYRSQADTAMQNAKIEARKQEQIADNYAQQAATLRARQRLTEGQQRAAAGSAGLNFAGSAMDILSSGYDAARQDQMNLLSNQRNDNFNSRVAESNYINQANAANAAAANVKRTARAQGFATILGTAASIYGLEHVPGGSSAAKSTSNFNDQFRANAGWSNNPSAVKATFDGKQYGFSGPYGYRNYPLVGTQYIGGRKMFIQPRSSYQPFSLAGKNNFGI